MNWNDASVKVWRYRPGLGRRSLSVCLASEGGVGNSLGIVAVANDDLRARCLAAGAAFLGKPLDGPSLFAANHAAIKR